MGFHTFPSFMHICDIFLVSCKYKILYLCLIDLISMIWSNSERISRGCKGCFQKVKTGLPFICLGYSFWPVEMWCILKTVSNCCTAPLKRNWQLLLAHRGPLIHIQVLRLTALVAKVNCFSFHDPRQIPCLLFIQWQLLFINLGDNRQQLKHLSLQNMSKSLNTHPYLTARMICSNELFVMS